MSKYSYTKEQIETFEEKVIATLSEWMAERFEFYLPKRERTTFAFEYQENEKGEKNHAFVRVSKNKRKKSTKTAILEDFQMSDSVSQPDSFIAEFEIFITPEKIYELKHSLVRYDLSVNPIIVYNAGLENAVGINHCEIEEMLTKYDTCEDENTSTWLKELMNKSTKAMITLEQLFFEWMIPISNLSKDLLHKIITTTNLSSFAEIFYIETDKLHPDLPKTFATETINEKNYYVIEKDQVDIKWHPLLLESADHIKLDADSVRTNIENFAEHNKFLDTQVDTDDEFDIITQNLIYNDEDELFNECISENMGFFLYDTEINLHTTDDGILIVKRYEEFENW